MMRKILVSPRIYINESYYEERLSLDSRWGKFLSECGLLPIIYIDGINIDILEDEVVGVLLTGGNDPYSDHDRDLERYKNDKALISFALKNRIPLLGVCAGMQSINKFFGGTIKPLQGNVGTIHRLSLNAHSFGLVFEDITVNSYHNFGIDKYDTDFEVAAFDKLTSSIESFVHRSERIFGIMWHPERDENFKLYNINIFKKFFGVL